MEQFEINIQVAQVCKIQISSCIIPVTYYNFLINIIMKNWKSNFAVFECPGAVLWL